MEAMRSMWQATPEHHNVTMRAVVESLHADRAVVVQARVEGRTCLASDIGYGVSEQVVHQSMQGELQVEGT